MIDFYKIKKFGGAVVLSLTVLLSTLNLQVKAQTCLAGAAAAFSPITSPTNETCPGLADGTMEILGYSNVAASPAYPFSFDLYVNGVYSGVSGTVSASFMGGGIVTNGLLTGLSDGDEVTIITCSSDGRRGTNGPLTIGIDALTPNEPTLSPSGSAFLCGGTGSVTISATENNTSGVAWSSTMTYSWTLNGVTQATGTGLPPATFNATATGSYNLVVDNGCTITDPIPLVISNVTLTASATESSPVLCFGSSTGQATVTPSGGTTYSYNWSNGGNTATITNLACGGSGYAVTVTETNTGCTATSAVTITCPPPSLTITETHTNPSCSSSSDGTISITVTGGTTPYTYSWSDGSSIEDRTGLGGGNYTITVTDAQGCTDDLSVSLTSPTAITVTSAVTNITCFGLSNGAINVTVTGGTTAYTYDWSNDGSEAVDNDSEDLTGLSGGTYTLTVTDSKGCTSTTSGTISPPAAITATIVGVNVTCNAVSNGSADLTVSGGTTAYTYDWSNDGPDAVDNDAQDISGLSGPTTYTVTVTDANSCTTTASVLIDQNNPVTLSTTKTNQSCSGVSDGTIDLSVLTGSSPYTYDWSNDGSEAVDNDSQDLTNLAPNTYTVTVTDAGGCTSTTSVTISPAIAITVTVAGTNPTCSTGCTGQANATVSGGTSPYTFSWSTGATSEDLTLLCGGTYSITVTDSNGCTSNSSVTLTPPSAVTATIVGTDATCNGLSNGSADLTPSGGPSTSYTYSWSTTPAQTTQDVTGLAVGTYTVMVTSGGVCTSTASVTISQAAAVTVTGVITHVACSGSSTGAIAITPSGGTSPYSYLWNTGQTIEDRTNLAAACYTITVTDAIGCTSSSSFCVTSTSAITITGVTTHVLCNGSSTGAVNLTTTGGASSYTWDWSNDGSDAVDNDTEDISSLAAGSYTVTVTDANSCTSTASFTITSTPAITVTSTVTDVSCNGGSDGNIAITVSGGTSPYTFSWSSGQATEDISGLSAGTYTQTITDFNSCTVSASYTVSEPSTITVTSVLTHVACSGGSTGAIANTISGGTSGYTYLWNSGPTTEDRTSLAAGTYTQTVTDANLCAVTASYTITATPPITITSTITDVACSGASTGAVNVTVTGGTTNYTYDWSNDGADVVDNDAEDLSGVAAGTYTITVTDANSCTTTSNFTVDPGLAITITGVVTNVTCNGLSTGAVNVTTSGGTTSYTFDWNSGESSEDISSKPAGTYTIEVTDALSCTSTATFTITEPTAVSVTATFNNPTCFGACDGDATAVGAGGTSPYSYSWTGSLTGSSVSALCSGTYTVTTTDASSCTSSTSVTPTGPVAFTIATSSTPVLCFTGSDGTATATPSGGSTPYNYLWSDVNTQSTQVATNLPIGTYTVTATDNNGCISTEDVTVDGANAYVYTTTVTDPLCNGDANGTVSISVTSGGTTPYSYSWSAGLTPTLPNNSGLSAGVVTVTISDFNSCEEEVSFTLTPPSAITLTAVATDVSCNALSDGSADATVSGGTTDYSYSWSNSATTEDISGVPAGDYILDILDGNGCPAAVTVTVGQPTAITGSVTVTDATCGVFPCTGTATADVSGGTTPYTYLWDDGSAQNTQTATALCGGGYSVIVRDGSAFNCSVTLIGSLNDIGAETITVPSVTDETCPGANDGTIEITNTCDAPICTITWYNPAYIVAFDGLTTVTGLAPGTYTVEVENGVPCVTAEVITVNPANPIDITETIENPSCFGFNDGSITLVAGSTSYTYVWSNAGETTQNITGLFAGTHTVTVTDNLCSDEFTYTLTPPSAVDASNISSTNITCNGADDGTAVSIPTGGTSVSGTYSYNWSNFGATQSISGLSAGVYTATVTDDNGCTDVSPSVTVTEPAAFAVTITASDVTCFGSSNGSANSTVTGGTTPYVYSWGSLTVPQSTPNMTGVTCGTYTLTISGPGGICAETHNTTISCPSAITLTATSTDITCNGLSDGTADATVSGGTLGTGYSYTWTGGATTEDISGLSSGTYTIDVLDGNSCSASTSVTIDEPAVISVTETVTDVTCGGNSDGQIALSVTGGTITVDYNYTWSSSANTTDTETGLAAGTYDYTVTDENGCTEVNTVTITQPEVLAITITSNSSTCGNSDGSLIATVTGGDSSYTYDWSDSNNQSTATASNLFAGGYTVDVSDGSGCLISATDVVSNIGGEVVTLSVTDALCFDGSDGFITASTPCVAGGCAYEWFDEFLAPISQTSATATGLAPGVYILEVENSVGCITVVQDTVGPDQGFVITSSAVSPSCFGLSDGSASVTVVSGGATPYSYDWSAGLTPTLDNTSGLTAGVVTVTITDLNSCTEEVSITIDPASAITLTAASTDVSCNALSDGSADATVSGGTLGTGYSYVWSEGTTTEDLTGVPAGVYALDVTDGNGCQSSVSVTIDEPTAIAGNVTTTDATCGVVPCTGTATADVTGGTGVLTYLWDAFASSQTGQTATVLCGNSYGVTVTDGVGCTANFVGAVTEIGAEDITVINVTDETCPGFDDGTIEISNTCNVPACAVTWYDDLLAQIVAFDGLTTVTGLAPGTYTVEVVNGVPCLAAEVITVNPATPIDITETIIDPSCFGGSDGSITLVASSTSYTYLWSNGETTQNLSNLTSGVYDLSVTEGACEASFSYTLTDPSAIDASNISSTNITCNGASDGTAVSIPTGGTSSAGTYSFVWSNLDATQSISGLSAGVYTVTVTDDNGCSALSPSVTITEPDAFAVTLTASDVICFGISDGSATSTVTGGTTPYVYSWGTLSVPQNTPNMTGVTCGTYTLTISGPGGICEETHNTTITCPSAITLTATSTDITCNGFSDGAADATVSGGTLGTGYSYTWTGGATTEDISGLSSGTYTLDILDGNSCAASTSVTIDEPSSISVTENITDISCGGSSDGEIQLAVSGGTVGTGYTYQWSPSGNTSDTESDLITGVYDYTVTDFVSCSVTGSVTLSEPQPLAVTITQTSPTCGNADGSLVVTSTSGGSGGYSYAWSDPIGQTGTSATGLSADIYNLTLSDNAGCSSVFNEILIDDEAEIVNTNTSDASCFGICDGQAAAASPCFFAPCTYTWVDIDDNVTVGTTATVTGLCPGEFFVSVVNSLGCVTIETVTITEPTQIIDNATISGVSCFGLSDGQIDLVPSGGDGTSYSFVWSASAASATTQAVSGLGANTYTVTISDDLTCSEEYSYTLTNPTALVASISATDVTCNGLNNGILTSTVSGGSTPYSYAWGNGVTDVTSSVSALAPGVYDLTVTGFGGTCSVTTNSVTISEPAVLAITVTGTDVLCFGQSNGTASTSISGGNTSFSYLWSPGNQTTSSVSALAIGTYTVTVTDNKGCSISDDVTIGAPLALAVNITATDVTCNGFADGTATAEVSGGTTDYAYVWSVGAQATQTATGIAGGNIAVTVTDNNGCTITSSVSMTPPSAITLVFASDEANCLQPDGSITVTATGGTGTTYTYVWDSAGVDISQFTATATGLFAGIYNAEVTDANGCTQVGSGTISNINAPTITVTDQNNVSCFDGNDGSIDITVSGTNSPFSYNWNPLPSGSQQDDEDALGLSEGVYTVQVDDAAGCITFEQFTITEPTEMQAAFSSSDATCGNLDGDIAVVVSGGTSGYSYLWSVNNATTSSVSSIGAGIYIVSVTDNNDCGAVFSSVVNNVDGPVVIVTSQFDATCFNSNDGSATVSASGGVSPYSYLWIPGSFSNPTVNTLSAGDYVVQVTDANGCPGNVTLTINSPDALTDSTIVTSTSCGGSDGALSVYMQGGTAPYTYSWTDLSPSITRTGLAEGIYDLTVTDGLSCVEEFTFFMNGSDAPLVILTANDASCNGLSDGSITSTVTGGTTNYSYQWKDGSQSDISGQTASSINTRGTGTYILEVTDAAGCLAFASADIEQPDTLLLTTPVVVDALCNGSSNGSATALAVGGTLPYDFVWSNNQSIQTSTGLAIGTYTVSVSDQNGCSNSAVVTVSEPTLLVIDTVAANTVLCVSSIPGSIDIQVNGGTSPYTYLWSNASTSEDINGLASGDYCVTVTDANGCTDSYCLHVGVPVVTVTSISDVNCSSGNDGSIDITVTGNRTPFTYLWNPAPGASLQTDEDPSGLSAQTYHVIVSDSMACTAELDVIVGENSPVDATFATVDATCGDLNGEITATPSGGVSPYTYLWNNMSTAQTLTTIGAGVYEVTITDNIGCSNIFVAGVNNSDGPVLVAQTSIDATCFSGSDGFAGVIASGGQTPYSYNWIPGGFNTDAVSTLSSGSYLVEVTDGNFCLSTLSVTVGGPSEILAVANTTPPSCSLANGALDVTASGGNSGYTYLWDNFDATPTRTGLAAGTYSLTVTDASSCTETFSYNISNSNAPLVIVSSDDANCNGNSDGSATAVASGGTSPYSYQWQDEFGIDISGETSSTISNIVASNYSVSVTDNAGCVAIGSISVEEPDTLKLLTPVLSHISCFGNTDGMITANAIGGSVPYTFVWSTPSTGQATTGLLAGTYTVTITDNNGCSDLTSYEVIEPVALSVTLNSSGSNACSAGGSASIDIVVSGGTSPYTYVWSNAATTEDVTGVTAGNYCVTVTDNSGCTEELCVPVEQPVITLDSTVNVSCNGGEDGEAYISVAGTRTPFTYQWNPTPGISSSNAEDALGLGAGTYEVIVFDNTGCSDSMLVVINEPDSIIATFTKTESNCGVCDGAISVSLTGGTSPFTYLWSNNGTTASQFDMCAGVHSVMPTDQNGCVETFFTSLNNIEGPDSLDYVSTNVSCFGGSDGTASVTQVYGGVTPYSYNWIPGPAFGQGTPSVSGLTAGLWIVGVEDAINCAYFEEIIITQPTAIDDSAYVVTTSCNQSNGSISLTAQGGTGTDYTYAWSNGESTSAISSLPANIYMVTVTDNAGCTEEFAYNIGDSEIITTLVTNNDATCFGESSGSATISATGANSIVSYLWSDGQTDQTAINLPSGQHFVTVTDDLGCLAFDMVEISQPDSFAFSNPTIANVACNAESNGSITVVTVGATPTYTFAWSNGTSGQSASNLVSGSYSITVTDSNNCTAVRAYTVTEPTVLVVDSIGYVSSLCEQVNTGEAKMSVVGGITPYSYLWTDGQTVEDAVTLFGGNSCLTVTDNNGCVETRCINIPDSIVITLNNILDSAICEDQSELVLFADASVSNGLSVLSYLWNDNLSSTNDSISPTLVNGVNTFSVTVSHNGCFERDTVQITVNTLPDVEAGDDLEVLVYLTKTLGGEPTSNVATTFAWSPGTWLSDSTVANPSITAREDEEITYTVTVTDDNGCSAVDSLLVKIVPNVGLPSGFSPNGSGPNDLWIIDFISEYPDVTVEIFNRWGELLFQSTGYTTPWDGTFNGKPLPVGTYYYIINLNHPDVPDPLTGPVTIMR